MFRRARDCAKTANTNQQLTLVVCWFEFISSKYLDGREALNSILTAEALVLISIDRSHLYYALQ